MATVFQFPDGNQKLSHSAYRFQADYIAPGVVDIVDDLQSVGEDWWVTLERSLPYMTANDAQKTALLSLTDKARNGVEPEPITSNKIDAGKLLTWASVGALLLKVF
jgi:hypothetical protein